MSRPIPPAIYALKAWTIKEVNGKYFIARTASFDDKTKWSRSYKTLHAACCAITRQLAEEWNARNARRSTFYRIEVERAR